MRLSVALTVLAVTICVFMDSAESRTSCRPSSKFKLDCNVCRCSNDGFRYSCTNEICPQIRRDEYFDQEITSDGHVVLKPKKNHPSSYSNKDDEDFVLSRRNIRDHKLVMMPYVDDEIPPPSSEDIYSYKL